MFLLYCYISIYTDIYVPIDLTEAEDIKKRWQNYIQKTQITTMMWSLT